MDDRKFAAARLWATARMPYLASAIFASEVISAPGSETISVDRGWRLHADPTVVSRLSADQLGRLLIHLCGHLIRDHAARAERVGVREDHGAGRWNRCADAEINDDLESADLIPHVAPEVPHDLGCEAGRLAEAYWEDATDGTRHWDCGAGADGCDEPGEGAPRIGDAQADLLRLSVAAEIQQTANLRPGTVSAGWLRWAESMLPSRVDWRRVLAAEIRSALALRSGMVDYSYRRPSRRAAAGGDVILATLQRPVPEVAIVLDTSGSMHEHLLARALAEVEGVLKGAGLRSGQLRVLTVDAAVQAVKRVTGARQIELGGGGGTNMGSGIAAAAALRPRPNVAIVLTDGYTPWPDTAPRGMKVIVGILAESATAQTWPAPEWARTIVIDD